MAMNEATDVVAANRPDPAAAISPGSDGEPSGGPTTMRPHEGGFGPTDVPFDAAEEQGTLPASAGSAQQQGR